MSEPHSIFSGQHLPRRHGLYDPALEHDACGVGFVAHLKGERSNQIVRDADVVLRNMDHRGACGCEANTGDGAGVLTALPYDFCRRVAKDELKADLPAPGEFAAGLVFLPQDGEERALCKKVVEQIIEEQGQRLVGWRKCPQQPDVADIGPTARAAEPWIEQLFVAAAEGASGDAFERQLYLIRKRASHALRTHAGLTQAKMFYVCSLSTKVIIYKGMLASFQVLDYLPRPGRGRLHHAPGDGPLAVQHQYVSLLGPRPTVPLHEP